MSNKCDVDFAKCEDLGNLYKNISSLFLNEIYSDVVIKVEDKSFHCHRAILAARCPYFRSLLYDDSTEESQKKEVELKKISITAFELLLKFVYRGELDLSDLQPKIVIEILRIAHQYRFECLAEEVSAFLSSVVYISNALSLLEIALKFQQKALLKACISFIEENVDAFIKDETLVKLSKKALIAILQSDTLFVDELRIFHSVRHCIESHPELKSEDFLAVVRLNLISFNDLLNLVWPTKLYPDSAILKALKSQCSATAEKVDFRGCCVPELNVAARSEGAKVTADNEANIRETFSQEEKPALNQQTKMDCRVKVALKKPFRLNCVVLQVFPMPMYPRLYKLEISFDGNKWFHVKNVRIFVDDGAYSDWLKITFPAIVVRFFRVSLFELTNFKRVECLYINDKI